MSQPDRDHGPVPARAPEPAGRPAPAGPAGADERGPDGPGLRWPSARLARLALRRHWWRAALLWASGTTGLMALAYFGMRPVFEASSAIRVEPGDPTRPREAGPDFEVYKQTQARRIAGPDVIAAAIAAQPALLRLPGLARAGDPEAEIGGSLAASVVPGTDLIQVSMASESAAGSAGVVNAVVDAYLEVATGADEEGERRCRRLREVERERAASVRQKREAIARLVERSGASDAAPAHDRGPAATEAYRALTQQVLQADLELVEVQARLDRPGDPPGEAAGDRPRPDSEVVTAFYAIPPVAEVQSRLVRARDALAQAGRGPSEGSRAASKKVEELQAQLDGLWVALKPALARADRAGATREADRLAAEDRAVALKARLARLNERIERLDARARSAGVDELGLEFARQDLARAESALDDATREVGRAESEARRPVARLRREYRARAPGRPVADHRPGAMAAAPAAMFLAVLGLFTLAELRAGRVVAPEDLPGRLRLGVLGVLPPPPRPAGRGSARRQARRRRELDLFLRGLDHLRVAIGSGRDDRGRPRRSIVITSACAGEGKTTLAARLAERCAGAGLATLLVNADLRDPGLSRMLDLPVNRGLSEVLEGEATAEEVISVLGGAGGVYFLPAGSPRVDPGRLLHGDRLAGLLARAREGFDLVIVDAPPVLPVPDALTIGRWVDAAVLAVRSGESRSPLVGRAHRMLEAAGVPVLGAVIGGVRGAGAAGDRPLGPPRSDGGAPGSDT